MAQPIVSPDTVTEEAQVAAKAVATTSQAVRLLLMNGLKLDALQWVIDDPLYRDYVTHFMNEYGVVGPVEPKVAAGLLDKHFVRATSCENSMGVRATQQAIPFLEQTLRECRLNYLLFPGASVSIGAMRNDPLHAQLFDHGTWRSTDVPDLQQRVVEPRWYLIRMSETNPIIPFGDDDRPVDDKYGPMEERPYACEVVYMMLLWYHLTGEKLFQNVHVSCADGHRVGVGWSEQGITFFPAYAFGKVPSRKILRPAGA